jgi:hypothetical protein
MSLQGLMFVLLKSSQGVHGVTLLLDTHAFLWFSQDDPLLSTTAKALIEDANNRKLLSVWRAAGRSPSKPGFES